LLSFRRASGYVEQFDVQSPELTVVETILYSARLRLDPEVVKEDRLKVAFVNQLMKTLELWSFRDSLVGLSEDGGLSFEQKKRLSIAVELAASPSIVFLDEPTSGLDARSAALVVKLLRKIASQGRTICATIHQVGGCCRSMVTRERELVVSNNVYFLFLTI
jgi:ABC-type multidrug transport system ATPase subunit